MRGKSLLWAAVFIVLISAPTVAVFWLSAKDANFGTILRQHECFIDTDVCEADFNGDGRPGELSIDRASPAPRQAFTAWLVAKDEGRELLRLPYQHVDNTLRTHVGIRYEAGKARLIVFNHIEGGANLNAVFLWNGSGLEQAQPSDGDRQILTAMAARDDAGDFNGWVFFRVLKAPVLIGYYLLLSGLMLWRLRRPLFRALLQQ